MTLFVDYGPLLQYLWIMLNCYNICGLWSTVTLIVDCGLTAISFVDHHYNICGL